MRTERNTTHRTCVMSTGYAHYGDGTVTPMRAGVERDLCGLLSGTTGRFEQHACLVLDGVSVADLDGQSDAARRAGWRHSQVAAWTLFHRTDGRTVALGLRDEMNPKQLGVLITREQDPGALAVLLDRYQRAAGTSWRGTCSLTALAAIRLTWGNDRYQPLWNHAKTGPGYATGPLVWSRELNEWERSWGFVHTFDANSAYLGSAMNAECAWSSLHPTGPREFDRTIPGYWLVELNPCVLAWDAAQDGRPPLFGRGRVRDGRVWLTTPYARLVEEIGGPLWVVDSWTAQAGERAGGGRLHPAGSRVLRKFAEQFRDARASIEAMPAGSLRDTLLAAVKRTYKDATGGMQREGMRVYRPDWAHHLIDLWRATLMRRIIRVHESQGVWPVEIKTDSLSYADCTSNQPPSRPREFETLTDALNVDSCEVGCGCAPRRAGRLGGFKHQRVVSTRAWVEEHKPKERKHGKGPLALVGGDRATVGNRPRARAARPGPARGGGTQRAVGTPTKAAPKSRKRTGA